MRKALATAEPDWRAVEAVLAHFADVTDPYLFRSILRQLAECRGGGWRKK